MILKSCIEKLMRRENLDAALCQIAIDEMLDSTTDPLQIAAFLVLLRSKPETAEELSVIVTRFRQKMIHINTSTKVLDLVGTGGDGAQTINISTGSAILAASCGVKIAKHGNRAVSSLAGSADVLTALGINIHLSAEKIVRCIDEIGIGFCFSPAFHPAFSQLRELRKQLSVPTSLNIVGPLLNPAHAHHFLLGTLDESLLPIIAKVIQKTGCGRSVVVHGSGLDEISCAGITHVIEIQDTSIATYHIDPRAFGLSLCSVSDLRGGDAQHNAEILLAVFSGKTGPIADTLILNAAVALYLYDLYPSIAAAIPHARENLANQSALRLLQQWREISHDE